MSESLDKDRKKLSAGKMIYQTDCEDSTSRTVYSIAIGLTVIFGLLFSYLITQAILSSNLFSHYSSGHLIATIIIYFAASLGGSYIMNHTEKPAVCLGGFALMAAGMGIMLTVIVAAYTASSIANAFLITMGITAVMTLAATAFPNVFLGMGRMLGLALLAVLIVEIAVTFLFRVQQQITDYIVILLFTGFIGYDWALAQQRPATVTNAIRSAASIYLDVVNILIRILSIIGKRKD